MFMADYSPHLLLNGNLALPQGHTSLYFLPISKLPILTYSLGAAIGSLVSPLTLTYHYTPITCKIYCYFEAYAT